MDFQTIQLTIADGIARLVLNRPEVKNALNAQMRAEIPAAIRIAQDHARVLVMTGAGSAFCSGQDLGDGAALGTLDIERVLRDAP